MRAQRSPFSFGGRSDSRPPRVAEAARSAARKICRSTESNSEYTRDKGVFPDHYIYHTTFVFNQERLLELVLDDRDAALLRYFVDVKDSGEMYSEETV